MFSQTPTMRCPEEAVMSHNDSKTSGLAVRTAIRAGRLRADQPDPPNRRTREMKKRRLSLAQFGMNEHGVATFTKA